VVIIPRKLFQYLNFYGLHCVTVDFVNILLHLQ